MAGARVPFGDRNTHNETPPAADGRGQKNLHSPWSAPRDRRKRNKQEPAPLTIAEESEYASPPKRLNGGTSPAARELRLSQAGAPLQPTWPADPAAAGPLQQGVMLAVFGGAARLPGQGCDELRNDGFSPLGSALAEVMLGGQQAVLGGRLSSSMGFCPALVAPPQPGGQALHLAECSYGPLDIQAWPWQQQGREERQQGLDRMALGPSGAAHPGLHRRGGPGAGQQRQLDGGGPAGGLEGLADTQRHSLRVSWGDDADRRGSPHLKNHHQQYDHDDMSAEAPAAVACSAGAGATWADLQARVQGDYCLQQSGRLRFLEVGLLAAHTSGRCGSTGSLAGLSDGGGGGASLRDSMDGTACLVAERQTSSIPLRLAGGRGTPGWEHSHVCPSPAPAAADAGRARDGGGGDGGGSEGREHSRARPGSSQRKGCFSGCLAPFPSPFCSKGGAGNRPAAPDGGGSSDEDEIVRRNDDDSRCKPAPSPAADFFIRQRAPSPESGGHGREQRCTNGGTGVSMGSPPVWDGLLAGSADWRRRQGEGSHPPVPAARQGGFTARGGGTPLSARTATSADSFDGSAFSIGLRGGEAAVRPGVDEMLTALKSTGPSAAVPTIDTLNAMLSSMCRLGDGAWEGGRGGGLAVHPKDAEELVAEVCSLHGPTLAPNATTRLTLDRIWAVHDQLHG